MHLKTFLRSLQTRHILILLPLIWLFVLLVMFTIGTVFQKLPNELNTNEYEMQFNQLNSRLSAANQQIDVLMQQNRQLVKHLQEFRKLKKKKEELIIYTKFNEMKEESNRLLENTNPGTEYEQSRRRLRQDVNDLWHYLRKKLDSSSMGFVNELRYNMLIDFDLLEKRDNIWRRQQLRNLSDFVQQKIKVMQNPNDCKNAKKLVCDLNKSCGFGCQMVCKNSYFK
jgi:glycoprotein 6-alpha-L-fucosyltransferase